MISVETEKAIHIGLDEGIPMEKIARMLGVNVDTVSKLEALQPAWNKPSVLRKWGEPLRLRNREEISKKLGKMIPIEKEKLIREKLSIGVPIKRISKMLTVDRRTIRKIKASSGLRERKKWQ